MKMCVACMVMCHEMCRKGKEDCDCECPEELRFSFSPEQTAIIENLEREIEEQSGI